MGECARAVRRRELHSLAGAAHYGGRAHDHFAAMEKWHHLSGGAQIDLFSSRLRVACLAPVALANLSSDVSSAERESKFGAGRERERMQIRGAFCSLQSRAGGDCVGHRRPDSWSLKWSGRETLARWRGQLGVRAAAFYRAFRRHSECGGGGDEQRPASRRRRAQVRASGEERADFQFERNRIELFFAHLPVCRPGGYWRRARGSSSPLPLSADAHAH